MQVFQWIEPFFSVVSFTVDLNKIEYKHVFFLFVVKFCTSFFRDNKIDCAPIDLYSIID